MNQFDLVVFGASGYTGQFVAEEVARHAVGSLTWAVAGRSAAKLEAVLAEASKHVGRDVSDEAGIIIADVEDQASLEQMCSVASVLLSCVGPYKFYGAPVIEACIAKKCHYVDICGEPEVLENFEEKYHTAAEKAGIHIVQSCGFDSIPADLGMQFTIQKFPGFITQAESFHLGNNPDGFALHSGTWKSLVHGLPDIGQLRKKAAGGAALQWQGPKLKPRPPMFKLAESGCWAIPFPGSDTDVVRRSQRARQDAGEHPVQYGCYLHQPSCIVAFLTLLWGVFIYLFTRTGWGTRFAENHPSLMSLGGFSEAGSTREQLEVSSFSTTFYAKGFTDKSMVSPNAKPDARVVTRVSGPECGYIGCSILMVQCALCLNRGDLPNRGGVLTPAVAFHGTDLIPEIEKAGVKFTVVETS